MTNPEVDTSGSPTGCGGLDRLMLRDLLQWLILMRTFVHGKIHGIRITECKLRYNGSAEIDTELLEASGIAPYEQIQVANMANGERLITYAFPGAKGQFTLNGAAARLGSVGDDCLVIAYRQEEKFSGAKVVFVNPADNSVMERMEYPAAE